MNQVTGGGYGVIVTRPSSVDQFGVTTTIRGVCKRVCTRGVHEFSSGMMSNITKEFGHVPQCPRHQYRCPDLDSSRSGHRASRAVFAIADRLKQCQEETKPLRVVAEVCQGATRSMITCAGTECHRRSKTLGSNGTALTLPT